MNDKKKDFILNRISAERKSYIKSNVLSIPFECDCPEIVGLILEDAGEHLVNKYINIIGGINSDCNLVKNIYFGMGLKKIYIGTSVKFHFGEQGSMLNKQLIKLIKDMSNDISASSISDLIDTLVNKIDTRVEIVALVRGRESIKYSILLNKDDTAELLAKDIKGVEEIGEIMSFKEVFDSSFFTALKLFKRDNLVEWVNSIENVGWRTVCKAQLAMYKWEATDKWQKYLEEMCSELNDDDEMLKYELQYATLKYVIDNTLLCGSISMREKMNLGSNTSGSLKDKYIETISDYVLNHATKRMNDVTEIDCKPYRIMTKSCGENKIKYVIKLGAISKHKEYVRNNIVDKFDIWDCGDKIIEHYKNTRVSIFVTGKCISDENGVKIVTFNLWDAPQEIKKIIDTGLTSTIDSLAKVIRQEISKEADRIAGICGRVPINEQINICRKREDEVNEPTRKLYKDLKKQKVVNTQLVKSIIEKALAEYGLASLVKDWE